MGHYPKSTGKYFLYAVVDFDCNLSCPKIVEIPSRPPAIGGGKRCYQQIWTTTIAICKVYGQVY
ncbi:MAG: hypothetical protein LBR79_03620 [Oscillospiraceae bacterium]|nr:hypothetical protein [Oscillospiraceae bacterium]